MRVLPQQLLISARRPALPTLATRYSPRSRRGPLPPNTPLPSPYPWRSQASSAALLAVAHTLGYSAHDPNFSYRFPLVRGLLLLFLGYRGDVWV